MIEETMELLVWWTLRATLLLGGVGLVVMALRSRAASLRHALWVSAIAGSLALPVLACILPSWGILPNSEPPAPAGEMRASEVPQVTVLVPVEEVASRGSEFMPSDVERPPGEDLAPSMAWDRALVIGWALGTGILLVRLLIGQCSTALLVRFRSRAYLPGVRITGREIPPMVCGLLAPKIILPAAALAWSDDRLEAVLRHERAHICRGDLWWGWGARLLCAAQWFNPLVWIAAARMRSESEHACDDTVIRAGMGAKQYAGHLLEIASMVGAPRKPLPAVAMASGPEIEGRLRYALDPQRRRHPLGSMAMLGLALLLAPVTLVFALATEAEYADELAEGDPSVQGPPPAGAGPVAVQDANQRREVQTIVLDPAHGGRDMGATVDGEHEKDINLQLALVLRERLESAGFRVVLTRWDDSTVSPDERVAMANRELGAVLLSLTADGSRRLGAGRVELVSAASASPLSTRLSNALVGPLATAMPQAEIHETQASSKILDDTRIGALIFDAPMPPSGNREVALARVADALAGGFTKWAESPPKPDIARNQLNSDGLSISADNMAYDAERQLVVGKGSVELVVDEMELLGDGVEYSTETGLLRMFGGSVKFTGGKSEGVSGRGATIEFDEQAGLLKLINHYSLKLGSRLVTGSADTSSATFDLKTGKCTMDGPSMTRMTRSGQAGKAGKDWINPLEQPAMDSNLVIPLADGFDFPVGAPGGDGYYVARSALPDGRGHLGEDWNGKGGGNTDEGDPVYSIGNGRVIFARDVRVGHGNVVIIRHVYLDGDGAETPIESVYVHLGEVKVEVGDVVKRGEIIGTIGTNRGMYLAHLHFEIRKHLNIGMLRSRFPQDETVYHRPSDFIEAHRPQS